LRLSASELPPGDSIKPGADPRAATPQPNFGISLAKTPRAPSSELLFPFAAFASLRDQYPNPGFQFPKNLPRLCKF
jgi:hypothetical protein